MPPTPSAQRLSEVIKALRFPLMALVVFAHVPLASDAHQAIPLQFPADGYVWYRYISHIISFIWGGPRITALFVFSGYYMYLKRKDWWDKQVYREEMKKRWKTLMIPYLIWCTISLIADQGMTYFKGGSFPWGSWGEALARLHYAYLLGPEDYPLWFLRDLILLALLAPIVSWTARRAPWVVALLFIVQIFGLWPWSIPALRSVIYILLGAVLGTRQIDILTLAERHKRWILPLFTLLSLALPLVPRGAWFDTIQAFYVPIGIATWFCIGGWIYDHAPRIHQLFRHLATYVFFIYVAHEVLILSFIKGFFYRHGWLETVWGYFLCGGLVTGTCILGYLLLKRLAPRPLAIALGGHL